MYWWWGYFHDFASLHCVCIGISRFRKLASPSNFKDCVDSPGSYDGRSSRSYITLEIYPPYLHALLVYIGIWQTSGILNCWSNDHCCCWSCWSLPLLFLPTILCTISSELIWIFSVTSSHNAHLLHTFCTHSIFIVVLAINDKHSMSVKYLPTISPFGIDGNTSTQSSALYLLSLFKSSL